MEDITNVTPDMVVRVYSGIEGCMCGCRGKYHDRSTPAGRRMVAKVLNTMKARSAHVVAARDGSVEYYSLYFHETSRVYVLWLTD